ncbi:MAG: hypothetical protein ACFWUC_03110 [Oscillospiraceae bacterium]|jgi:trimeric autotransporter adhesin
MRVKRKILPIIACLLLVSQPIGCAANHTDIKSESTASTASDSESRNTTENTEVQTESSTSEPSSESPASSASAAANSTNSEASSSVSSETSSEEEKAPLLSDAKEKAMDKVGIPENIQEEIRKLVAEGKTFEEAIKTFYPNAKVEVKTVKSYETVSSPAQNNSEETQSNSNTGGTSSSGSTYHNDYLHQGTQADLEALREAQKNNPGSGPSGPIEDPGITLH